MSSSIPSSILRGGSSPKPQALVSKLNEALGGSDWQSGGAGVFSVGAGNNSIQSSLATATGIASIAIGSGASASGNYSTAIGFGATAVTTGTTVIASVNRKRVWCTWQKEGNLGANASSTEVFVIGSERFKFDLTAGKTLIGTLDVMYEARDASSQNPRRVVAESFYVKADVNGRSSFSFLSAVKTKRTLQAGSETFSLSLSASNDTGDTYQLIPSLTTTGIESGPSIYKVIIMGEFLIN